MPGELWSHFSSVITWIEAKFKHTGDRVKILKGLDWGALYAKYGKAKLDVAKMAIWYNGRVRGCLEVWMFGGVV